ncbi:MAG: outer membrane beta-barrel protein [Microscillaceae bacterium]|jgi:hypothetical protein|nr:outer membrane beta-barrel protein [Microscillaceae bacterium]
MKTKLVILIIALWLGFNTSPAQNFYGSFSAGYGLGIPQPLVGYDYDGTVFDANNRVNNRYGSFGAGFNLNLAGGYMFTENIGVELGFNYLFGSKTEKDLFIPTGGLRTEYTRQLRVMPSIIFSTGGEGVRAYLKAGLIMPVLGKVFATDNTIFPVVATPQGSTSIELEFEVSGNPSVGYQGAIGVMFPLGDKLHLFGEIQHVSLLIKNKEATLTKATFKSNGQDALAALRANEFPTTVKYVDNDPDIARGTARAERYPFHNLGLNVGIRMNF